MVNLCKILREPKAEMKAEILAQEGSRVETGEAHSQVKNEQGRERAGKETNLNTSTDGHLSHSGCKTSFTSTGFLRAQDMDTAYSTLQSTKPMLRGSAWLWAG